MRFFFSVADHKQPFDRIMVHDMFVALTTTAPGLCLDDMKKSLIQVFALPSICQPPHPFPSSHPLSSTLLTLHSSSHPVPLPAISLPSPPRHPSPIPSTSLLSSLLTPCLTQVDCFGGKINEQSPTATVIAQRDYRLKLQFQTYWDDEDEDTKHLGWISHAYKSIYHRWGGV